MMNYKNFRNIQISSINLNTKLHINEYFKEKSEILNIIVMMENLGSITFNFRKLSFEINKDQRILNTKNTS